MFTLSYAINKAKTFLAQNLTGQLDFSQADFVRLLHEETLPTFSIYMPYPKKHQILTDRDKVSDYEVGTFLLNTEDRIINVARVFPTGASWANSQYYYSTRGVTDMLGMQQIADYQSMVNVDITYEFRAPNVIEFFPKVQIFPENVLVELNVVHPDHLNTIPMGSKEVFMDLFLADVANDVLGIRQYFQSLQNPFGEFSLNLDRLNEQAQKRKDIIDLLTAKQLKSSHIQRVWIG